MSRTSQFFAVSFTFASLGLMPGAAYAEGSHRDYNDSVTGYRCVTGGCDTLFLPQSNCVCQKQNPAEQKLSKLVLVCTTGSGQNQKQCPVRSRYGINAEFRR